MGYDRFDCNNFLGRLNLDIRVHDHSSEFNIIDASSSLRWQEHRTFFQSTLAFVFVLLFKNCETIGPWTQL